MNSQRKKKILYVVTKSNWGGAQRYVYDLATNFSGIFDVSVALGGTGDKNFPPGILQKKLAEVSIPTVFVESLTRNILIVKDIISLISLFRVIKKENPDIIHLNSSKAGLLGSLCGCMLGVRKIVFTAHGWVFKEHRSFLTHIFLYVLSWFTVLLSHATIVVSRTDKKIGERMWFAKEKIKHIPIGVNKTNEILERSMAERRLSFGLSGNPAPNSRHRLVTIAELTKNKGVFPYGLQMIKKLEQDSPGVYSYTVFGSGEDLPKLQNQIGNLPIYFENVSELSKKPSDLSTSASKYLKAFDIFILPSIKEGMPYALLEAVAARLPIIATNIVKEEFSDLPNIYFVPPKDGEALARKVEEVVQNIPINTPGRDPTLKHMISETSTIYA